MPERKRVLLVFPYAVPPGGGEGLAAHALQALQDDHDVSIACYRPPDFETLNRHFATALRAERFTLHTVPRWLTWTLERQPTPQALARVSVLEAFVRRLSRGRRFDVYLSLVNEMSLPERGIQYVHFPRIDSGGAPAGRLPRVPGALAFYRATCGWIGGATPERLRRNVTLANSAYTASLFQTLHGVPARVVHPPAPGHFAARPWSERKNRVVCVGRILPGKDVPRVVEIVGRLRALGHELSLVVVGAWSCSSSYRRDVGRLLERHRAWVSHEPDLSRDELTRLLAESRYGIHAMVGEPFGMAVAEMQRAGCIAFVPRVGGPSEIVGHEPRVVYGSVDEAVAHADEVLRDPRLQAKLHTHALARGDLFTVERFTAQIREHVDRFARERIGGRVPKPATIPEGRHGSAGASRATKGGLGGRPEPPN